MKIAVSALFFTILLTTKIWAAACCGGGGSVPNIIISDSQASATFSLNQAFIVADASEASEYTFRQSNTESYITTYSLSYTRYMSESFQLSFSAPFLSNYYSGVKGDGFGDIEVGGNYEFMPEIGYHLYKPRGFVFASLKLDTGTSFFEAPGASIENVTGDKSKSLNVGVFFTKFIKGWDLNSSAKLTHRFPYNSGTQTINYQFGGGLQVAAARNIGVKDWQAGFSLGWNYLGSQTVNAASVPESYFKEVGLNMSYSLAEDSSVLLSYLDQTLIGEAKNTDLKRSLIVSVKKLWF